MPFDNSIGVWVNIAFTWICCIGFILVIGSMVSARLRDKISLTSSYAWGVTTILAVEECIYLICMVIGVNFNVYTIVFSIALIILLAIGIKYAIQNKIWNGMHRWKVTPYRVAICIIAVVILYSVVFTYWGGSVDDTYYMGKANEIIRNLEMQPRIPSSANGMSENSSFYRADVSSMIVLYSFVARIFGLHPVVVARTVFSPLVIILGFAVIIELARSIFDNEQIVHITTILAIIIMAWIKNGSAYSMEYTWIKYPWHGATTLVSLIYLFISQIALLYARNELCDKWKFWLGIILINMAMLQNEIVGVFMLPCTYLTYGIPFLFLNRDKIAETIKYAIISLIPEFLCGIYILISYFGAESAVGQDIPLTWKEIVYGHFLWGGGSIYVYFAVYAVACVYFLFRGTKMERGLFFFSGLTLALTLANPFLFEIVTGYLTTKAVYYRIFFCLPISFVVAGFVARMYSKLHVYGRYVILGEMALLFAYDVYLLSLAHPIINPSKASEESVALVTAITEGINGEDIKIVPCYKHWEMRLYSDNIKYTCSKYSSSELIDGTNYTYFDLYDAIKNGDADAISVAESLGTKYIVYDQNDIIPECLNDNAKRQVGGGVLVTLSAD